MKLRLMAAIAVGVCCLSAAGCGQQSFLGQNGMVRPSGQHDSQLVAQMRDLNQRLSQFDADNRDLHAQIAQWQQKYQIEIENQRLLKQQLSDMAQELKQTQVAKTDSDDRLNALQASTRFRGGATITANSSLRNRLEKIQLPGLEVRADGEVIRIELPTDRLFVQGTTQLQPNGAALLQQLASAIRSKYSRQIVGIEGHTDSSTLVGSVLSPHQLAADQSMAVFHHMTRHGLLPTQQLFTMQQGSNRPRFSNGDAAGRARNRRIEFVIYPETYGS